MSARPLISACLIVNDEEDCLARCLESVQGLVAEIVVVDTGSADSTGDIARAHGAHAYERPCPNDFALDPGREWPGRRRGIFEAAGVQTQCGGDEQAVGFVCFPQGSSAGVV